MAMLGYTPGDLSSPIELVNNGWDQWSDFATNAYSDVEQHLTALSELDLTPVSLNVQFDVPAQLGAPFQKPPKPIDPNLVFGSVESPGQLTLPDITPLSFEAPPLDSAQRPSLNLPQTPGVLTATPPGDAPTGSALVLPAVPTLDLPADPVFALLSLPTTPTISTVTFDATAPVNNLVAPGATFAFTDTEYSASVLSAIQTKVSTWLNGGTGLPDWLWNQIWDRARANEERTAQVTIRQAAEGWAARGFSLPGGVLNAQILEAQQKVQDAQNTLNRELAIQQATQEQENLRFAVTQGVALENMLVGMHEARAQRALQAAQIAFEASINIFNAKVNLYNAELSAYATAAQVFRDRIQAELSRVEVYRAQLEGQRVVGELNRQKIEQYNAQIGGLTARAELYRTQVQGVQAQVDIDRNRVEAYRATVEAYGERVRAKTAEFESYGEQVRAELSKSELYRTDVEAFRVRVEAYRTQTEALGSQQRLQLDTNNQRVQAFVARIEKYNAEVGAEAERIRAGTSVYEGKSRLYAAELGAEQARVVADSRQFELALESGRAQADLKLRQGQTNIEQVLRLLALEQEGKRTLATVQSQLAAAAMSAVNLSAGVDSSSSSSKSVGFDYSGEVSGTVSPQT